MFSACPSCSNLCPACYHRDCVPRARRIWDRCTSSTYGVKFCSIVIMLKCAFIALTGRGVTSILQAIVGLIFAIEGFWGAVRFDRPSIKRFLIFIVCDFATGLTFSILNLETVNSYCSTADPSDNATCVTTATLYAYILLSLSVGVLPVFFIISTLFYLQLLAVHESQLERGKLSSKLSSFPFLSRVPSDYDDDDDEIGVGGVGGIGGTGVGGIGGGGTGMGGGGYIGTLIKGDVDEEKQQQVRMELAHIRGDEAEVKEMIRDNRSIRAAAEYSNNSSYNHSINRTEMKEKG